MLDEMTSKFAIMFLNIMFILIYSAFGSSFAKIVIFISQNISALTLYHLSYFIFKIVKHTCDRILKNQPFII